MNEITLSEDLRKEVTTLEEMTKTVAVRNAEERALVFQTIQTVKVKKNMIVNFFADMKDKAFKAHRAIVAAEKAETDKLDAFEVAGKRAILAFDKAEEEKREAERRRLQAIADEARLNGLSEQGAISAQTYDAAKAALDAAEAALDSPPWNFSVRVPTA